MFLYHSILLSLMNILILINSNLLHDFIILIIILDIVIDDRICFFNSLLLILEVYIIISIGRLELLF